MLTIRSATPSDLDEVSALYARAFGRTACAAWLARRDWQYLVNPAAASLPMQWVVALDDGRVVGSLAATPWRLKVGTAVVHGYFTGDLMVSPLARRGGVARQLWTAMMDQVVGYDVCAFYHPVTGHIAERCGYVPVGAAGRLARVLAPGPVVAERVRARLGGGAAARLAGAVAGAAGSLATPFFGLGAGGDAPGLRIERATAADARFDELWARTAPTIPVLGVRDAAFVQWRFFDLPGCEHRVLTALDAEGTLRGYVALAVAEKDGLRLAYVLDLSCPATDALAIDALIVAAEREARAQGAAVVLTAGLFPTAGVALRQRRWLPRRSAGPMLIYWRGDPSLAPLVVAEANWSLSLADGDDSFAVGWRGG